MTDAVINRIRAGGYSRSELLRLRDNAEREARRGNPTAPLIVEAINTTAVPELQREYVFMGFCPGADFENRQDELWIKEGICKFDFIESESQMKRFSKIMSGDTMILKKRHKFGKTMHLYGHGKVKELKNRKVDGLRYLLVDWSNQKEILEVPLMGCNSTVDVRTLDVVDQKMHVDFWRWLGSDKPTAKEKGDA